MQVLVQQRCIAARARWSRRDQGDRMSAGFVGGGGTWALETLLAQRRSQFWYPKWEVWNAQASDQRIWRVTYDAGPLLATEPGRPPDIERCVHRLREALTAILAFSEQQKCDPFTQDFRDALSALDGKKDAYHPDLAPAGVLTDPERRALQACQFASVFGAMGSWNDMSFEGSIQGDYEAVSSRLFAMLGEAVPVAANGFSHRRLAA